MLIKGLCLLSLGIGVFLLVQVAMPYLAFKIWELANYSEEIVLVDPSPNKSAVLGVSIEIFGNFPAFVSSIKRETIPSYKTFKLTIPSIELEKVEVAVDSNDFEENLAHLPGTALPGEKGNVFISGHSSLTQFYRPGNFKAIFANLPKVKKGEVLELEAGGQKFRYIVLGIKVVDPDDIGVINPPDSRGRYLTLMTCVPPGFNTKRLVVVAKLI